MSTHRLTVRCQECDAQRDELVSVEHVFPPIPTRAFDYSATSEDYDGGYADGHPSHPIGYGATEREAIAEYLELVTEECRHECKRWCVSCQAPQKPGCLCVEAAR